MSKVTTKIKSHGKAKTALEKLAALKAQMAALEVEANNELTAQRSKVDTLIASLPEKLGMFTEEGGPDFATFARAVASYAKNGTAYPAGKLVGDGDRKTMVRLTDAQWKEADAMLLDTTEPSIGKRAEAVAAKFGIAKESAYQRYYSPDKLNKGNPKRLPSLSNQA